MARTSPSRVSASRILADLRAASRKGDRAALALAVDQMKTLALSPRYWERYLLLLKNPLARLVDLLVIKQGERIARQKGWTRPRPPRAAPAGAKRARDRSSTRRRRVRPPDEHQPMLFDLR
jgi:hypothetical protein